MRRINIACSFCNGEGRVEEFTCPCCLGEGTLEKEVCDETEVETPKLEPPKHDRVFNSTPAYQQRKAKRYRSKRQCNRVALCILGLPDVRFQADEREGVA